MITKDKMNLVKKGEGKFDTEICKNMIFKYKDQARKEKQSQRYQDDDRDGKKKIDYKGKAIAGKQAATEKQVTNAMGQGGG